MKFLKQHWLILVLVLVILFTRLLILNKDAVQFWADEGRYPILIANLDEASKSENYLLPIQRLFNIDARPGAGLFYYPSAFIEWINPHIPVVSYYNLIINILILLLVFFIIKKVQNKNVATLSTFLITLSIASFIYMRHSLPYDISLLLLLIGLYSYVYFQRSFVLGLFAGLSFLTYPSYYYYIIPIPFMLFLYNRSIKSVTSFIIGILLVICFTQFLSLQIGASTSYFRSLKDQSGGVTAINQGDYLPAVSYIGEYILAVDGYWNLFLILTIFPGILLIKDKKKIIFFAVYLTFVFLILEAFSHILQKHVLYGRTIRPFYLSALVFSVLILERILSSLKNKKIYYFGFGILILITCLNWLPRFIIFKNLIYPDQFKKQSREYLKTKYPDQLRIEEALFVNYFGINSPPKMNIFKEYKEAEQGVFYIVNANDIYPYYGSYDLNLFCKSEVLLKEPHVQYTFRPSLFEGQSRVMREQMAKDPLYYQLIHCKS